MRNLLFILPLLLLLGCPRPQGQGNGPATQGAASTETETGGIATVEKPRGPAKTLLLLCSSDADDTWTSSVISAAGDKLGIDPWKATGESGHLDTLGPYETVLGGHNLKFTVAFSGMQDFSDIESLNMLGEKCREWIVAQKPDVLWLEGDPAQFYVGSKLNPEIPIVFSGVEGEIDLYYEPGRKASGVYRRHSISRVIGEIWKIAPEAKTFSLLSDDSPLDMQKLLLFRRYETALPPGSGTLVLEPVKSWSDFRVQLDKAAEHSDALILCGIGGEGASAELLNEPVPANLFASVDIPVVALGPTLLDHQADLSLQLQPAAHAEAALGMLEQVLGGSTPQSLGPLMPEEMSAFRSEEEGDSAPAGNTREPGERTKSGD